jgi:hypothetical protein
MKLARFAALAVTFGTMQIDETLYIKHSYRLDVFCIRMRRACVTAPIMNRPEPTSVLAVGDNVNRFVT